MRTVSICRLRRSGLQKGRPALSPACAVGTGSQYNAARQACDAARQRWYGAVRTAGAGTSTVTRTVGIENTRITYIIISVSYVSIKIDIHKLTNIAVVYGQALHTHM